MPISHKIVIRIVRRTDPSAVGPRRPDILYCIPAWCRVAVWIRGEPVEIFGRLLVEARQSFGGPEPSSVPAGGRVSARGLVKSCK